VPEVVALVDFALDVVREAGGEAVRRFRTPMSVGDKATGSQAFDPVTEADRQVEAHIRRRLRQAHPQHAVVGEEHGRSGDGPVVWMVDPIDGTRSFLAGLPTWGTLLGLVVDEVPVAGIVHQPWTDETWVADPVRGARFLRAGASQPIRSRAGVALADAVLVSTHPSMLAEDGVLDRYEHLASRCRLQRYGGDCYAFALVAHGQIDLVVDGALKPYDIVPLIPIIEEAGGVVTTVSGGSAVHGGTVVAAGDAALHAQALALLSPDR
jgi:myo-inositol-1(or 4)-monophosphatase